MAERGYADLETYLLDLVERDREGLVAEPEDSPEYIAWVREMLAEGEASGISDENPIEFIDRLIAERAARNG